MRTDWTAALLGLCVLFFITLFTLKAIQMHQAFETAAYDLGIFQQALWLISQFQEPFNTIRGMHSHGDHFRLVDYLYIPAYLMAPSIYWAFFAQALSVGLGALVLYRIAHQLMPTLSWAPSVFALAYLLNPVVHNPLLWQYHPLVLASGIYLLWLWFYVDNRSWPYYLVFALLLTIREDMCVTTALFGVVAILQRRYRFGIPVLLISIAWWLLVTRVILPELNGLGLYRLEKGVLQILNQHLFDFDFYVRQLQQLDAWTYWAWLFLPLLCLSLLVPVYLLPTLPTILINPLVGGYSTLITYHYSVNAMPFIFLAALFGYRRILDWFPRLQMPLMLGLLAAASTAAWQGSKLTRFELESGYIRWHEKAPVRVQLKDISRFIGPDSGIAATDFYVPHLSHRRKIYLFPNPWRTWYWGIEGEGQHHPNNIDFLVLNPRHSAPHRDLLTYLVNAQLFEYILKEKELHVLQRVLKEREPRTAAIADWEAFNSRHRMQVTRAELGHLVASGETTSGCKYTAGKALDLKEGRTLDIDLTTLFPGVHTGTAEVYAYIESTVAQQVELSLGVDDGVTVWQGEQQIAQFPGPQAFMPDQHSTIIQLEPGENRFCFRVDNIGGAWRLQVVYLPLLQN